MISYAFCCCCINLDSVSDSPFYYFGLFSLADRKSNLQLGDLVTFQLIDCRDETQKAFNMQVVQSSQGQEAQQQAQQTGKARDSKKGKIESLKGHVRNINITITNLYNKFMIYFLKFIKLF